MLRPEVMWLDEGRRAKGEGRRAKGEGGQAYTKAKVKSTGLLSLHSALFTLHLVWGAACCAPTRGGPLLSAPPLPDILHRAPGAGSSARGWFRASAPPTVQ
jgi:hypothetical protein